MRLEAIAAEIRPRRPAEAMDLGVAMVRAWWKDVYGAWLAVAVPAILLAAAVFRNHPLLAFLAFWLVKPLLDHAPLYALGRALFGERSGAGAALRALPGIWRRCGLAALTIHRLDPGRAFTLPVSQLERLRGAQRRARVRILSRRGHGETMVLKGLCSSFELALLTGLVGFAMLMLPSPDSEATWIEWLLTNGLPPRWVVWSLVGAELLAVLVIEPVYVAGGFSLYLARRTQVEAWDVEMGFRRLTRRLEGRRRSGGVTAAALAAVLLAGGEAAAATEPALEPEEAIQQVMEDPDFATTKKVSTWGFGDDDETKQAPRRFEGLEGLSRLLGQMVEPVLWVLTAAVVAWLLWRAIRLDRARAISDTASPPPPTVLFGLDVRADSLPADVAAEARRLLAEGQAVAALSLLYRGALASLVARQVPLARSATEGDCLKAARAAIPAEPAGSFARLTAAWQACAYAHRTPDTEAMEALLRDWPVHFGGAA